MYGRQDSSGRQHGTWPGAKAERRATPSLQGAEGGWDNSKLQAAGEALTGEAVWVRHAFAEGKN